MRLIWSHLVRALAVAYLVAVAAAIVAYKAVFWDVLFASPVFGAYGIAVCALILGRFALSLLYRAGRDRGLRPSVAIVMPAFNEEEAIACSLRSLLELDYPAERLEIVAVNDGSSDGTLEQIESVAAQAGGRVRVIDLGRNQGKRAAMAAGIRATRAEIVCFVDSDSTLEPDALTLLVQRFADPQVGAVAGHADVQNASESWITRMQVVRYFVAFKVVKAAESVFGAVTCCSGCFSAYRRAAIVLHLEEWENQRFLGNPATFGDDRALTNLVLRGWKVPYEAAAVSHTLVPAGLPQFLRQQARWKRSWSRESLISATFMHRKHPVAALLAYSGILLTLIAPVAAAYNLLWRPLVEGNGLPVIYLAGFYAMALIYGLYYTLRRGVADTYWAYGVAFVFFYLGVLVWQTYYALLTARRTSWGTRPAAQPAAARIDGESSLGAEALA